MSPEPAGTQLLEQFVDQSIKEARPNNEDTSTQLRKVHSLKVLALKVAAHFKWDFDLLQSRLEIFCSPPPPPPPNKQKRGGKRNYLAPIYGKVAMIAVFHAIWQIQVLGTMKMHKIILLGCHNESW